MLLEFFLYFSLHLGNKEERRRQRRKKDKKERDKKEREKVTGEDRREGPAISYARHPGERKKE